MKHACNIMISWDMLTHKHNTVKVRGDFQGFYLSKFHQGKRKGFIIDYVSNYKAYN